MCTKSRTKTKKTVLKNGTFYQKNPVQEIRTCSKKWNQVDHFINNVNFINNGNSNIKNKIKNISTPCKIGSTIFGLK